MKGVHLSLDIALIVVAVACLLIGTAGVFVPILPGVPLAWAGLFAAFFSDYSKLSVAVLVFTGIAAVFASIADNVLPSVMTKKSGGSKYGSVGSMVGMIAGFFLGPLGIIFGPFAGALVGELIYDSSDKKRVFKAALGTFKGFLAGIGLKFFVCSAFIWIFIFSLNFK